MKMRIKMKNIRKIILVALILLGGITIFGCSKQKEDSSEPKLNIEIAIYDDNENNVYEKATTTTADTLLKALEEIDDLQIETEESQYGAFIISLQGIEQTDGSFWNYYVNEEYATVGVSSYEIKDNDKFEFRLEKFE
jgi:hypothetical protein